MQNLKTAIVNISVENRWGGESGWWRVKWGVGSFITADAGRKEKREVRTACNTGFKVVHYSITE